MQVFAGSESLPVNVLLFQTLDFYCFPRFEGLEGAVGGECGNKLK